MLTARVSAPAGERHRLGDGRAGRKGIDARLPDLPAHEHAEQGRDHEGRVGLVAGQEDPHSLLHHVQRHADDRDFAIERMDDRAVGGDDEVAAELRLAPDDDANHVPGRQRGGHVVVGVRVERLPAERLRAERWRAERQEQREQNVTRCPFRVRRSRQLNAVLRCRFPPRLDGHFWITGELLDGSEARWRTPARTGQPCLRPWRAG